MGRAAVRAGWMLTALFACSSDDAAPPGATEARVDVLVRGTAETTDDFVAKSAPGAPSRRGAALQLTLRGTESRSVTLRAHGSGEVSFDRTSLTLAPDVTETVIVFGESESAAEGDTLVEVLDGEHPLGAAAVTVVRGVRIAFSGTFRFVVDNNNGWPASLVGRPFTPCGNRADPPIWRTTPLPCEGLADTANQLHFAEDSALPDRWSLESGKRPRLEVVVIGVRTFGPEIDLDRRDLALQVGTPVLSLEERRGVIATLKGQDCDANATTGNPLGQEDGAEAFLTLDFAIGELRLSHSDRDAGGAPRLWTRFPTPETPEDAAADTAEVIGKLLPGGGTGCSSPEMTYFDENGAFVCQADQSLRTLLLRNAGLRGTVRRAWANVTTRRLDVLSPSDPAASWVADLFSECVAGDPSNANGDPGDDVYAEGFLQLTDYDWYTLMGRVSKGVAATPGGVDARFQEWPVAAGCPSPEQPTVAFEDDPFLPP